MVSPQFKRTPMQNEDKSAMASDAKNLLSDDDIIDVNVSRYAFAQPICQPNFAHHLPPMRAAIDGLFIADTSYYYPEDRSISESVHLGKQLAEMALLD